MPAFRISLNKEEIFKDYGRIRDIHTGPDGSLWSKLATRPDSCFGSFRWSATNRVLLQSQWIPPCFPASTLPK